MRPRDVIEEVLVGDVVDLVWEAARYRRIRARAMEARLYLGVARIVEPHEQRFGSNEIAEGWARGEERQMRVVDKALGVAGLGPEHVAACAFLAQVSDMERLDRLIAATETRRAAALREIDRHRAARLRDGVGVVEVEEQGKDAGEGFGEDLTSEDHGLHALEVVETEPGRPLRSGGVPPPTLLQTPETVGGETPPLHSGTTSAGALYEDDGLEAQSFGHWGGLA